MVNGTLLASKAPIPLTLPEHAMPELLITPSLSPTPAASGTMMASVGDEATSPGPTFATLLQARLAPSDTSSRLKQLGALLVTGMPSPGDAAPATPTDLSTLPEVATAPGGLAALIAALFQQQTVNSISPTSAEPLNAEHDEPVTDALLAELFMADPTITAGAIPLAPPVQTPPVVATVQAEENSLPGETLTESIPKLEGEPLTQAHGATTPTVSDESSPAKGGAAPTTAAIVADTKAVAPEIAPVEIKVSSDSSGQFQELLAAAQGAQHAAKGQGTAPVVTTHVETPVGNPGWGNEVGDRLVWMAHRADSRAELVLNPPQMGRIEVSITLNGDQANAVFISASQAVRDALEGALPRLREVLADAGIQLDQTHVGADSPGNASNNGESGDNSRRRGGQNGQEFTPGIVPIVSTPSRWQTAGTGLVDTFA
ncbi:conserved protein of unknown function [Denitratisoma oestradiolicum]|uniref:Flagellar hook-length control protein-like C-terminal domain-containing protein n=2 Tax=Denitratisoma oestradiolicum TaxID=311182 RepID=A0A6S6XZV6_9PROT|nr:conserved protein of unknown function [Denitratisoma oestradiolicum]